MKFTTRDRPNDPHGICSAYFGFASQIETVRHAVSILGIRQIEDLVLATSIADAADVADADVDLAAHRCDPGTHW